MGKSKPDQFPRGTFEAPRLDFKEDDTRPREICFTTSSHSTASKLNLIWDFHLFRIFRIMFSSDLMLIFLRRKSIEMLYIHKNRRSRKSDTRWIGMHLSFCFAVSFLLWFKLTTLHYKFPFRVINVFFISVDWRTNFTHEKSNQIEQDQPFHFYGSNSVLY